MRIGIDARWIFREMSGIGVYTGELIRHLAKIDRQNQYVLFFQDAELKETMQSEIASFAYSAEVASATKAGSADNFTALLLNFGLFSIKNQLAMPAIIKELNLDVFHSTNYMIPLRAFPRNHPGRTACIITIHDLIPLISPESTPRSLKTRLFPLYRRLMREVTARSRLIITVSDFSRNDIIARLHCPPERVLAIPEGVAERFQPADKVSMPSSDPRFFRRKKIILWVGRQDPYKNLTGLIEAFSMLRRNYRGPLELRLIGPADSRYPEASRRIIALGLAGAVNWVGHISASELVGEYQNANVFVMPSYYEGFGLPVLEAFACGTPVICSNKSSLPEICGSAALMVDPKDISGICGAMHRVLTDSRLAGDLAGRGLRQAARFNWRETARKTILAYEQALM